MKVDMKAWREQLEVRLEPALAWFRGREPREQKVLVLLGVTIAVLLLFVLVWQPVWSARERQIAQWESSSRLLAWLQANEPAVRARQASAGPRQGAATGGDWVANLSRTAGEMNLNLKSVNAEGTDTVRVQLEEQPFAQSLAWLSSLAAQGVEVVSVEFVAGNASGMTNLRATLRRTT